MIIVMLKYEACNTKLVAAVDLTKFLNLCGKYLIFGLSLGSQPCQQTALFCQPFIKRQPCENGRTALFNHRPHYFRFTRLVITMPNLALAASSNEDINIISLLCIGGQSSRMGLRKELFPFPDGLLAFEHALITIHDAMPTADTIYISLHDKAQLEGIQFRLDIPAHPPAHFPVAAELGLDEHYHSSTFPVLEPIFDLKEHGDIGPAAGLLAAHAAHPTATLLVLGCNYPLLPPAALQQLILEYEPPLTCFVNMEGFAEPLIAIWSPDALDALAGEVREEEEWVESGCGDAKGQEGETVEGYMDYGM